MSSKPGVPVQQQPAAGVGRRLCALTEAEWWDLVDGWEGQDVRAKGLGGRLEPVGADYAWGVWCRNAAGIWLMGHCGLRVSELCLLPWSSVWGPAGCLGSCHVTTVVAKGGRERIVPLDGLVEGALQRLRVALGALGIAGGAGRVWGVGRSWRPAGVRRVRAFVAALGAGAVGRVVRPHELRHTFATRLSRVAKLEVVQQLLGHRSLASTQRYLAVTWQDKVDAVKGLS